MQKDTKLQQAVVPYDIKDAYALVFVNGNHYPLALYLMWRHLSRCIAGMR